MIAQRTAARLKDSAAIQAHGIEQRLSLLGAEVALGNLSGMTAVRARHEQMPSH